MHVPHYTVTFPIAGHAVKLVEAENEDAAIEKARMEITSDDFESWDVVEQFTKGNVCYCPQPWNVEVTEEKTED